MRSTYTYAVLEISEAAYLEIRQKLEAAGYQHAFHDKGADEVIDMHGIAVKAEVEEGQANPAVVALAVIEEMAEERHLLHGGFGSAFWNCSRPVCKKATDFLRGNRPACAARRAGTAGGNDPQDCDWPWCGCDPLANRVLASIQEQGLAIVKQEK